MATVIEPTTDAVDESVDFFVQQGRWATVSASNPDSTPTAVIPALVGTEKVNFLYSPDDGESWQQAYDDQGNKLELNDTRLQIILKGIGKYKVSKDATTSLCGVYENK